MKRMDYDIIDSDIKSTVWETKIQLEEMIEYYDGTTYEAGNSGEYGRYRKKGIKRIIWNNAFDTWVYGPYTVNEYGCVA